ncbi:MAG: tripartite tricarboxylate transporter substrate binding protein [Burkholderiales bacterium]
MSPISIYGAFVVVMLANLTGATVAQDYPSKPVRIIAPFTAGGSADTLGRLVARELSESLKQNFFVENRAGAGGAIGSELVARSPPDGYTLLVSGVASHTILPAIAKVPYDPMASFSHISLLGGPPNALVVNTGVTARNIQELLALARSKTGGLAYGTPGKGTHGHLVAEMFQEVTGAPVVHVPYKGAAAAMTDLISGQIPMTFTTLSSALGHIRAGKLRALAVTSRTRMKELPEVPTFAELGYPQLTAVTWFSLSGPAGMDPALVAKLNTEVRKALRTPRVMERLALDGAEPNDMDAGAFTQFVAGELARWTAVSKKLKLDD